MKTLASTLAALVLLAGATPALADRGGDPNSNASENAGGSANAHGGNENASSNAGANGTGGPSETGIANSNARENAHGRNKNASPRAAMNEDPRPSRGVDSSLSAGGGGTLSPHQVRQRVLDRWLSRERPISQN